MNESRLDKISPLSGVAAIVIMLVGVILFNNYEFLPPAEKVVDFLNNNASSVYVGGYIASLSSFLFIWFAGSLRSTLIEHEGGNGQYSNIAFGGGVAASVVLGISFVGILTSALRAGTGDGITPIGAITMFDFYGQLAGQLFALFIAVLITATSVISLRTGIFPSWFGWVSLVVAFGLLTPLAYAVLGFAILWLLVVSIWLYIRGASRGESPAVV